MSSLMIVSDASESWRCDRVKRIPSPEPQTGAALPDDGGALQFKISTRPPKSPPLSVVQGEKWSLGLCGPFDLPRFLGKQGTRLWVVRTLRGRPSDPLLNVVNAFEQISLNLFWSTRFAYLVARLARSCSDRANNRSMFNDTLTESLIDKRSFHMRHPIIPWEISAVVMSIGGGEDSRPSSIPSPQHLRLIPVSTRFYLLGSPSDPRTWDNVCQNNGKPSLV
ncbi:hypothetical protein EGW08_007277 [Elysia chlorotica]|uniref:Uncharacterized protein n=1 Tax=Elysia chlorotica TaxID=188477 RepID=A0A3S1A826_ELYCH|nr:hypothetical protein EGW08_007277 [Elysia chlorotica]